MAYDCYLKLDGIEGEATAVGMEKQIGIFSFSWGASAPAQASSTLGGLSASKVSISSLNLMKQLDKSSVPLFQACCTGAHIAEAILTIRKQTGTAQDGFLIYTLSDVMVDSIQTSGSSGGDDTPTESISLAFAKFEVEYKTQGKDGKLVTAGQATWDLTKVSDG
jgi:type VI secretion system secreted protein Hcp